MKRDAYFVLAGVSPPSNELQNIIVLTTTNTARRSMHLKDEIIPTQENDIAIKTIKLIKGISNNTAIKRHVELALWAGRWFQRV
jgi:hypothetical protein